MTVTTAARKSPSRTGRGENALARARAKGESACVVSRPLSVPVAGIALEGRLQARGTGLGHELLAAATEGTFSTKTRSLPHPSRATSAVSTLLRGRAREARSPQRRHARSRRRPAPAPRVRAPLAFRPTRNVGVPREAGSSRNLLPSMPGREPAQRGRSVQGANHAEPTATRVGGAAGRPCPTTPAPGGAEAPKPPRAAESP